MKRLQKIWMSVYEILLQNRDTWLGYLLTANKETRQERGERAKLTVEGQDRVLSVQKSPIPQLGLLW